MRTERESVAILHDNFLKWKEARSEGDQSKTAEIMKRSADSSNLESVIKYAKLILEFQEAGRPDPGEITTDEVLEAYDRQHSLH